MFWSLISLVLHFIPLDFCHFLCWLLGPQATPFYLDPLFLFLHFNPLSIWLSILIFSYFLCFSSFLKDNVNASSIRKLIKYYEMNTLIVKMRRKYIFAFFIFSRRYQQNKIVENYKMDMWTIEMHWKQFFFKFLLFLDFWKYFGIGGKYWFIIITTRLDLDLFKFFYKIQVLPILFVFYLESKQLFFIIR